MNTMHQFCFGIEQEHPSITLLDDGTTRTIDKCGIFHKLIRHIQRSGMPYLPGESDGLFTPYGRLYLESVGKHVETGVIPCDNPGHALQNDLKLTQALKEALMAIRITVPGLNLLRNNIDYITRSTWASHESYAITCSPEKIQEALIPFLVTRQAFAGSGTIMGGGMRLSPRAMFMNLASGGNTTSSRAIYSISKDEPLMVSPGFMSRLHLIVGDGLMSQFGQWLKLGVTALVIRAAEINPSIGEPVKFDHPVSAIRALTKVKPASSRPLDKTLLSVQRHYLREVGNMLECSAFPAWCEEIALAWTEVLDTLERDPRALCDRLDPYIKISFFEKILQSQNKSWKDVITFSPTYFMLAMLDVQYHALVNGLFEQLDNAGALDHRRFNDEQVRPGNEPDPFIPESLPRETLRARLIKTNSGAEGFFCGWTRVIDHRNRRSIMMNDPFSNDCCWEFDGENRPDDYHYYMRQFRRTVEQEAYLGEMRDYFDR